MPARPDHQLPYGVQLAGGQESELGIAAPKVDAIQRAITARALLEILDSEELQRIGAGLCQQACDHCLAHINNVYDIEILLCDFDGRVIVKWP